ncbi:MAG: hypothetical protein A2008_00150 [Candidatus Wallbacteria bacterium GWC2_49_35]|uniref:Solute-binding protein family 3/N-terminal domain-containing protein n=1 Tax=Candidatus Wallbacteria bacterium GWC2_49_35 TaxID=1817813 RepID=A0A1F7WYU1_9BACT|nr:MAG: hypothetical protein A2008_00150 [Candidatus Wallbacteria bacterium GWC2_49_35]HBC73663.1 hypothetical protein [Candidatus Wallbacteria bacterium]
MLIVKNKKILKFLVWAAFIYMAAAACVLHAQQAAPKAGETIAAKAILVSEPGDTRSITVLKVGRIPYLDPRKMVRNYEKMMDYLKSELQLKEVRLVLTPDYNTLTQFLKDGKIDVAWHGTFAYPKARETTGAKAVLTPIWSGKNSYCGIIVVRADSGIEKLSDLKGKSFAYTDKKSASGYFLPTIFLLENNIDPEKDFSKVDYLKKHDNILYNVLYKKFDAGAVYDKAFQLLKNDEERNQLKVIAKTPEIYNEPIMVSKDLPDEFTARLKKAFLKLKSSDTETAEILKDIGNIDGFTESSDADYESVVKMVEKYRTVFEEATAEVSVKTGGGSAEITIKNEGGSCEAQLKK